MYGPYCFECGDEYSDHDDSGCHATHMTMGPADNMDVDEIECDCGNPRLYTRQEVDEMVIAALNEHEAGDDW